MSNQFKKVAHLNDLKTSKLLHVKHQDVDVCLAYVENKVYAIDDMCTHEDAALSKGSLHGDCVKCPLHGSRFDLKTGEALDEPAEDAVKTYSVKIDGNDILLAL
jgi:3-phenylpropionate/trans-cinnamate dioxygenase ferredoxin subunit